MFRRSQEQKKNDIIIKKRTTVRHGIGIFWQLLLYFVVFALVILAVFWLFQVNLLDFFYERTRLSEFDTVADTVSRAINDDNFSDVCYECAIRYDMCIRVYKCSGKAISREIASVEATPSCLIHRINSDTLDQYYNNALENDGEWIKKTELNPGRLPDISKKNGGNSPENPRVNTPKITAVAAVAYTDRSSNDYVIFMNAEFTPMNTTVDTLDTQFRLISLVMLAVAALLAFLFSIRLSVPLVKMNAAAQDLAAGKYDTVFREEGSRETCELAQTLNYAAAEISRSDEVRTELIANVSHDLRTPLTMIAGYAEIMRDIPDERTPENVQVIIDESNRLSALVNDMLDLSKVGNGNESVQYSVFDLTGTVREVLQRYSALVSYDGYNIEFAADRSVLVRADRTMMLQVIYNLINNAINYAGEDKTVIVSEKVTEGKVRITVTDHGEGIPPEKLRSIWERLSLIHI